MNQTKVNSILSIMCKPVLLLLLIGKFNKKNQTIHLFKKSEFKEFRAKRSSDLQCIVRRYKRSNVAALTYKAGCSQYLKNFVWVAYHVNTRLEQKFMIPG